MLAPPPPPPVPGSPPHPPAPPPPPEARELFSAPGRSPTFLHRPRPRPLDPPCRTCLRSTGRPSEARMVEHRRAPRPVAPEPGVPASPEDPGCPLPTMQSHDPIAGSVFRRDPRRRGPTIVAAAPVQNIPGTATSADREITTARVLDLCASRQRRVRSSHRVEIAIRNRTR